jgi:hypothetical protein
MPPLRVFVLTLLVLPGATFAQEPAPIATDRPGFLFSSLTVGQGVLHAELGLPAVTLNEAGGVETRSTSLVGLLRFGLTDDLELRLGAPIFTDIGGDIADDSGFGDLEVGAKWHLLDNAGGRPSLALIPSVILPTGEDGFTAGDPVYQLNAALEWALAGGWGLAGLAGVLNGPAAADRFFQETFALSLGRSLPSPAWSAYGEVAHVLTDRDGGADASVLGGGVKYLVSNDTQLDLSFDRGLTGDSPDWLLGLGFSARF